jgi:hypothetical protein
MKRILITNLFSLWILLLFGQPQIKWDTTYFDCGQITQWTEVKKEFGFCNIGTETLIISDAETYQYGPKVSYPQELILPGKRGVVTFYYDTRFIEKFDECITVNSNSKSGGFGYRVLRVKGEVVLPRTTIKVDKKEKDIGNLLFGDVAIVQFEITNTGIENLHLRFIGRLYQEIDLLRSYTLSKDSVDKEGKEDGCKPDETIQLTFLIKNVYGNSGQFEHNLLFKYNSHDTLILKINGLFIGSPGKKILYEDDYVLFYERDKLIKAEYYAEDGELRWEAFFEGAYCVHKKLYCWGMKERELENEFFYKNGKLINTKYEIEYFD